MLAFETTADGLVELQARMKLLGAEAPRAMTRALNRTIATLKTETVRALADDTALKQALIRPYVETVRATFSKLVASEFVSGKPIPLWAFSPVQDRWGVRYTLPGSKGFRRSTFVQQMRSGHWGVFARHLPSVKAGPGRKLSLNLPIREQYGPSLPQITRRPARMEALKSKADAVLAKNLAHEIDYLLSRQTPSAPGDAG